MAVNPIKFTSNEPKRLKSSPIKIPVQKKCPHRCSHDTPETDTMRYEIATMRMYERIVRHRINNCTCRFIGPTICNVGNTQGVRYECKECSYQCKKQDQIQDSDEDIFPIEME